jgi:radical SAM superfamily enzyme YgiQ (UPF0313 family)
MHVKFILPSLVECESPQFRPIKYSLFPPLGLASLASWCAADDRVEIVDQHVMPLLLDDSPDLVGIEVYITNARRAYEIADQYRKKGVRVILGGLHVTSMPDEAALHADHIFLGPADESFPRFLADLASGCPARVYRSQERSIVGIPPIRRDLIQRDLYLVPNSIVVSRGCPHHCNFCYKDAFFEGGRSFYVQQVDEALAEIDRLPGRHLYFLDDHLLGNKRFAENLFAGMRGMNRLFQGASTVDAILRGDLIERAAEAGLRSIFLGFETLDPATLKNANKPQNVGRDYELAIKRLDSLGVLINGSFVFGLDGDGPDVFGRTVDWAVSQGLTTATFHIATPYPGTAFFEEIASQGRLLHRDWDRYDTRQVVFQPKGMSAEQLEAGYHKAYEDFYSWRNISKASRQHSSVSRSAKHFAYSAGWKKFEPAWDAVIRSKRLMQMRPLLEGVLSTVRSSVAEVLPGAKPNEVEAAATAIVRPIVGPRPVTLSPRRSPLPDAAKEERDDAAAA